FARAGVAFLLAVSFTGATFSAFWATTFFGSSAFFFTGAGGGVFAGAFSLALGAETALTAFAVSFLEVFFFGAATVFFAVVFAGAAAFTTVFALLFLAAATGAFLTGVSFFVDSLFLTGAAFSSVFAVFFFVAAGVGLAFVSFLTMAAFLFKTLFFSETFFIGTETSANIVNFCY
ncbi:MAG: hypothetical protein J6W81_03070, partial [Lentisphaeria bacterium]|nr:hypothetical protein [Lentisphaeria bacterium]